MGFLDFLSGNGSSAGILGTGQYKQDPYHIDSAAFTPDSDEQQLIKALQGQAYGTAPNPALQKGLDQAQAGASAMAASQRGVSPALAARMAAQQQAGLAQQASLAGVQLQQQGLQSLTGELQNVRQARENQQALASGNYNSANNINSQAYEGASNRRSNLMQGVGTAASSLLGFAEGGMVPHYAEGGQIDPFFAQQLALASQQAHLNITPLNAYKAPKKKTPLETVGTATPDLMAGGTADNVGTLGGAPEPGLPGSDFQTALAAQGGKVPGHAKVAGNSYANDTVPAMLSPGEIVVPREVVAQGPEAARSFIAALMRHGA